VIGLHPCNFRRQGLPVFIEWFLPSVATDERSLVAKEMTACEFRALASGETGWA
jgi:hypothetical protein